MSHVKGGEGASSRIEAILARAREKALAEEEERQRKRQSERESRSPGLNEDDDDDDDDDELSDVDFSTLARTAKRRRKTSSNSSEQEVKSEAGEDEDDDMDTWRQPEPSQVRGANRTRRAAAQRTEAYRFRPSLERPSSGQQLLAEAKLSALVQAGMAKAAARIAPRKRGTKKEEGGEEDVKSIRAIVAQEQRMRREGRGVEGLNQLLEMMRQTKAEFEAKFIKDDEELESGDGSDGYTSEDTSATSLGESSSADSDLGSHTKRRRAQSSEEQTLERALAAGAVPKDSGEEEDDQMEEDSYFDREALEQQQELGEMDEAEVAKRALAIVRRDRLGRESNDEAAEEEEDIKWRRFWTSSRTVTWPQEFVGVEEESSDLLLQKLRMAYQEDTPRFKAIIDSHVLCHLSSSSTSATFLQAAWLMHAALFTPTSMRATLAIKGFSDLLSTMQQHSSQTEARLSIITRLVTEVLPSALTRLGARPDVVADCFSTSAATPVKADSLPCAEEKKVKSEGEDQSRIRSGERLRLSERLLYLLEIVSAVLVSHMTSETQELAIDLGLLAAFVAAHPGHDILRCRAERLLEELWPAALDARNSNGDDEILADRIRSMLTDAPATCQVVYLRHLLPRSSTRTVAVRRWVAWRILSDNASESTSPQDYGPILSLQHLRLLLRILKTRDSAINALCVGNTHATEESQDNGKDDEADKYANVGASVELLGIVLSDMALQISRPMHEGEREPETYESSAYKAAVERFCRHQSRGGKVMTFRCSAAKVTAVREIVDTLRQLQGRISDHRGAFLVRAKVKDAMLRLAHELEYAVRAYANSRQFEGEQKSVRTLEQMGFGQR